MSNRTEDFDHAFEFILVAINVVSAMIAQYAGQLKEPPPIVATVGRFLVSMIFPTILTIIVWTMSYFTDDETWKMRLKSYSWGYAISLSFFEVAILIVISIGPTFPHGPTFFFLPDLLIAAFFMLSVFIPVVPFFILRRILKCYNSRLKEIAFFTERGDIGEIKRFIPILMAWLTFWLTISLAII